MNNNNSILIKDIKITMARSTMLNGIYQDQRTDDQAMWNSLKTAIANSSGFKRWQQEQILSMETPSQEIDDQVRKYLKETLETLAY